MATQCELLPLDDSIYCGPGGIAQLAMAKYDDIDWAAMVDDPTKFDKATERILGYTMKTGKTFLNYPLADREAARYENAFDANDLNTVSVFLNTKGKSAANRLAIKNLTNCCNVVKHVWGNDGTQRVIGVEYNSDLEKFIRPLRESAVTGTDGSGQVGTDTRPGDQLTLVDVQLSSPLFAEIDSEDFPFS